MKEKVKLRMNESTISSADISAAAFRHLAISVLGFISAKATVKGIMLPFGLSFLAGVTRVYCPSAALGVFIGYFFPAFGSNGFRYIASLFAILAIKLLITPYKRLSDNSLFLAGITLAASGITNTLTLSGKASDTLTFLCESFLAAGGAYFINVCIKAFEREQTGLSADEMASLLISLGILVMGLQNVTVLSVSVGKVFGILLILLSSKYGGTLSGAISGIAVSFALALTGNYNSSYFYFSLGGLASGVFSPLGKYAQCASILISFIADKALSGLDGSFIKSFAEAIVGCILFLITPKTVTSYIGKLFSLTPKIVADKGLGNAVNLRLNMASTALEEVSKTTEKVSKELAKINTPDFGCILSRIEDDTCNGCGQRLICWETKRNITVDAIISITKSLKGIKEDDTYSKNELKSRCIRFQKLSEATIKRYTEYSSAIASESRIEEVRTVVCNQFSGIAKMLSELSKDFRKEDNFCPNVANAVSVALKNLDIYADEVSAKADKYGRTTVTLRVKKKPETVLNKRQIMKLCSLATDINFDVPSFCETNDYTYITLFEHAVYKAHIGIEQISSKENVVSGDAYNYFNDGKGHTVMILSDGMGTGGRAAVDGAMASGLMAQLLKAGFGYDCSLNLLNSSMLFKSSDESLATLDIASIDLFTGDINLYKAGAAPTIVRRNGSCGKAVSTSLPIGILENVSFDTARIRLKEKDAVLLLSDGATTEGTDWIKAELETNTEKTAQELAEHICRSAKRRQPSEKCDDITVMVAIIEKAV